MFHKHMSSSFLTLPVLNLGFWGQSLFPVKNALCACPANLCLSGIIFICFQCKHHMYRVAIEIFAFLQHVGQDAIQNVYFHYMTTT